MMFQVIIAEDAYTMPVYNDFSITTNIPSLQLSLVVSSLSPAISSDPCSL